MSHVFRWMLLSLLLSVPLAAQPLSQQVAQLERDHEQLLAENQRLRDAAASPITLLLVGDAPTTVHAHIVPLLQVMPAPERARVEWSLDGVADSAQAGFNAAWVIEQPGDYAIRCTVTPPDGPTVTYTRAFTVRSRPRRTIYVADAGNDRNDGSTPQTAIRTAYRVRELIRNDTQVFYNRGDTFGVDASIPINASNVLIGAFGQGKPPLIEHTRSDRGPIIEIGKESRNVIVQDLAFDSIDALANASPERQALPDGLRIAGTAITVRRCEFRRLDTGINTNGHPHGMLVDAATADLPVGIRGYLVWGNGQDFVVRNSRCANSTREHCLRTSELERGQFTGNTLTNLDRSKEDRLDVAKGALVLQKGAWLWAQGNTLNGPNGIGPLGGKDGATEKDARLNIAVFRQNQINGSFTVNHGTTGALVAYNGIHANDAVAFEVSGYQDDFGRGVQRLVIDSNAADNRGSRGSFLFLQGRAMDVTLTTNRYDAPSLSPGSHQTAVLYIAGQDLTSFTTITGNTWPQGRPQAYADGGVIYLWPSWSDRRGYLKPDAWNAMPQVGDDSFK